jgi:tetratricopeptide (TPR) repeat protein
MSQKDHLGELARHIFSRLLVLSGFICLLLLIAGCLGSQPGAGDSRYGSIGNTPIVSRLRSPESSALYHFARGRLLADDGAYQAAAEALQQSIDFDPRSAYLRISLAQFLLAIGQDKRALEVAEEALQQNPELLDVHLLLGGIYFRDQDYRSAAQHFKKVIELDPKHETAYLHLTIAYGRLGERGTALATIRELLEKKPDSLAGKLTLGRLYRELDLITESEMVYRDLVATQPGLVTSYLELGALLESEGRPSEAAELYRTGLKKHSRNLLLRHRLIRLLVQSNELSQALTELQVLVELNPDDRESRRKIGLILLEQGAWADAEQIFSRLLALEPDAEQTLFYYATALEKQQRWQTALDAISQIATTSELFPDALYHRSYLQHQLGKTDKAIDLMRQRMELGEKRADFYAYLASLQELEHDIPAARRTLEQGIEQFPDDVDIRYHLGLLFEKTGDRKQALATMEGVLLHDPEHAEALNYIAYSLAERGVDLDRALRLVEKALQKNQAAHILDTLGWIHFRAGRLGPARIALERAAAGMSSDPLVLEHLGDIYRALGRADDALQAYQRALQSDPANLELQQRLESVGGAR